MGKFKVRGSTQSCSSAKWDLQVLVRPIRVSSDGFRVTLTGPTPGPSSGNDGSSGSIRYHQLSPGSYTLTLSHAHANLWEPFEAETLQLGPDGGKKTHRFKPKPLLNLVTPKITANMAETVVGGIVKLSISIAQTKSGVGFPANGTLTLSASHLELFRDEGATIPLVLDPKRSAVITNQELTDGLELYARGATAGKLQATLALDEPSKQDVARRHIDLGAPAKASVEVFAPVLVLFRDTRVLAVVPFSTTDVADSLDRPIPSNKHFDETFARPSDFDFPPKTNYGPHTKADADPAIFRVRLENVPVGLAGDDIEAKLKITTGTGADIVGTTGFKFNGLATKGDGMDITLHRKDDVWESPYLRVATTVDALSKTPSTSAIVHSPAPTYGANDVRDPVHGLQFGRTLAVSCTVAGAPVTKSFTLGGRPYAKVPVRFTWVSNQDPPSRHVKQALDRIADLNAYWAGHGLSFVLHDPNVSLAHEKAPDRTLLVLGEHTGRAVVSDHDIDVELSISVTVGGITYPRPPQPMVQGDPPLKITASILANTAALDAAKALKKAIEAWTAPQGALLGLKLAADVFDFVSPRLVLGVNANGSPKDLDPIGTHGPTDITISRASGPVVETLAITGVRVTALGIDDPTVDLYSPPVALPFHDPNVNPASAAQRRWVRAFGPPNGDDYVSVLVVPRADVQERAIASLHEAGLSSLYDANADTTRGRLDPLLQGLGSSTSPISILSFGRWAEPRARFIVFLPEGSFTPSNDLSHELGHTFADHNHTPKEPKWFYASELMHGSGPQSPFAKANKMTRHAIKVDSVVDENGWKSKFIDLADGYGGAARARIAALAASWLDQTGGPGYPWP